jgi:hypothetical protein
MRSLHEQSAGIRHARRPGIGYQCDVLAGLQHVEQFRAGTSLVVRMQRVVGVAISNRVSNVADVRVSSQAITATARRAERARAGIGEVADRRRDDVEGAGHRRRVNALRCRFVKRT